VTNEVFKLPDRNKMIGYIDHDDIVQDGNKKDLKRTNIFVTRSDISVAKPYLATKDNKSFYKHFVGRNIQAIL
jgi:hypothetical protein